MQLEPTVEPTAFSLIRGQSQCSSSRCTTQLEPTDEPAEFSLSILADQDIHNIIQTFFLSSTITLGLTLARTNNYYVLSDIVPDENCVSTVATKTCALFLIH